MLLWLATEMLANLEQYEALIGAILFKLELVGSYVCRL